MKKLWEVVKRYKFFLAFFSVNIALLFILPDTGWRSFEITGDNLLEMLSILPPIFVLLGLLDVWVERETMIKYMGSGSGVVRLEAVKIRGEIIEGVPNLRHIVAVVGGAFLDAVEAVIDGGLVVANLYTDAVAVEGVVLHSDDAGRSIHAQRREYDMHLVAHGKVRHLVKRYLVACRGRSALIAYNPSG